MNREKQKRAAMQAMIDWLADERELGRNPANILFAEEFDLNGLHYYIFKFQKELLGTWYLGVCGGYEGESLNHTGHIFSAMEEYHSSTAVGQAAALVKRLQEYYEKRMAEKLQSKDQLQGAFMGFILLSKAQWDAEEVKRCLKEDWGITVTNKSKDENALIFQEGEMAVSIALQKTPLTGIKERAARNILWPEAVDAAEAHKAALTILVMGGSDTKDTGILYAKLCASCLRIPQAIAVFTSDNVMEPNQFIAASKMMTDGLLPVFNWVFFGLYLGESGLCGYTNGLGHFGKPELEVIDSPLTAEELCDFLSEVAYNVLEQDLSFQDGEEISFSDGKSIAVAVSDGVAVSGSSVKFKV